MSASHDDSLADRIRTWREFCDAADASAAGNHQPAIGLCARHPSVAGELRSFVKALQSGRIRKVAAYQYENTGKNATRGKG
jgi:hypothetical protein